jgi:DNA repair protein RecO (recombination protein O)
MQWTDEAIVISVKRHGEASGVLELMTQTHGRHVGIVRGAFGSRLKPILQPSNGVSATWRARLEEHLGTFTVEGLKLRAGDFFASPHALYGITHISKLLRLLPERDPHENIYTAVLTLFDRLNVPAQMAPMLVRFEFQLLSELGFGLDLRACVATGDTVDLAYVSPKSGRAVSRKAGEPWAARMLRLPPFLVDPNVLPSSREVCDGFALTGFFLSRYVMEPRGLLFGDERVHLVAMLARAL